MATTLEISCPECDRTMKVPSNGVGKRVRCKGCNHAFIIEAPGKSKAPAKKGQAKQAVKSSAKPAQAKKKPTKPVDEDDEDDANPYGVTGLEEGNRCPECANKMASEDAVICLICGYDTRTRRKFETKRVYHNTGGDRFKWLLPGIICAVSVLLLIGYAFFHHFGLPKLLWDNWEATINEPGMKRAEALSKMDGWYTMFFHPGIELWIFITITSICFFLGKFAVKRLILNNRPPDVVKQETRRGKE